VIGLSSTWFSQPVNGILKWEIEYFVDELAVIPDKNLNPRVQLPGRCGPYEKDLKNSIPTADYVRWVIGYDRISRAGSTRRTAHPRERQQLVQPEREVKTTGTRTRPATSRPATAGCRHPAQRPPPRDEPPCSPPVDYETRTSMKASNDEGPERLRTESRSPGGCDRDISGVFGSRRSATASRTT
jgi:hypothetical protein